MKKRPNTKPFTKKMIVSLVLTLFLCSCAAPANSSHQNPSATPNQILEPFEVGATSLPAITQTPQDCVESKGKMLDRSIPSKVLGEEITAKIYLPPCYDSRKETAYSVLYMLHGQTSLDDQWLRLGLFDKMDELLAEQKVHPFIIVLPYELRSNLEAFQSTYDEAIVKDLIPYMDEKFRVCSKRECRAVGGLSRGGNWAVQLGFEYPDLFTAVGAHSAPLFYGELSDISRIVFNTGPDVQFPVFYVDVGNKDEDHNDVLLFVQTLEELKLQYQYNDFLGYHDEAYWSAHVPGYLEWYSSQLAQPSSTN